MRELFELALLQLEVWFLVSGYTPQPTTRVELGAHQEKSYEYTAQIGDSGESGSVSAP